MLKLLKSDALALPDRAFVKSVWLAKLPFICPQVGSTISVLSALASSALLSAFFSNSSINADASAELANCKFLIATTTRFKSISISLCGSILSISTLGLIAASINTSARVSIITSSSSFATISTPPRYSAINVFTKISCVGFKSSFRAKYTAFISAATMSTFPLDSLLLT